MATWCRPRSLRTGRSTRYRHDSDDEIVQLDLTKDLAENVREILSSIVKREGITKGKKLGYLNAFARLADKIEASNEPCGFTSEEIFSCLRLTLFHEAKEVRAAGLRCIRYLLNDERSIDAFLKLQVHHLVCRCMDIVLDNQIEHIQALRLMRRILNVCPDKFPQAFVRCLVAIANDGLQEKDRLVRACLATLSELVLLNSELFIESGCIGSILKYVLCCQLPRINEALLATILYLMNHPSTRQHVKIGVDLEQVLAPFTECHYRPPVESNDHSGDERENIFTASRLALLSILRSWPGMIRLCKPDDSGIRSLVDILYLPNADVRKGVMEFLLELFRLPIPEWTDDFPTALQAADPMNMLDNWKLYEGFVAEEGNSIIPHIAESRMNLIENHLALLLMAFITFGVLEALVEVIITSDMFVSVRATFLLGELLHLANKLLPHECSHHSHCLPTLMAAASSFDSSAEQRHVASAAITYLDRLHSLKKRGPVPCSLFLDQLVQFSPRAHEFQSSTKISRTKLMACLRKDLEDFVSQSIRDSQVLNGGVDFQDWDWHLISALLKMGFDTLKKMDDGNLKTFLRKLVHFYKPTSKLFSRLDLNKCQKSRMISIVGCYLMDFLVEADDGETSKLLQEFLTDFGLCLAQITAERSPLEANLSPNRILSFCCQDYFLFIGRLSHSNKGRKALEITNIYQYLLDLVSITTHDCYNKLIVSCLDYSKDGLPRIILTKILTATSETSRLYSTNFLKVLVRLQLPEFHKWGIELLVSQLYDKSRAVSLAALDVLDEACESKRNLEAVIHLRPSLLHLGDRGLLLLIRFMSLPAGFKYLSDANFVTNELERWRKTYNIKYVKIVEDELNDSLTHHQKGKDGTYGRRSSQRHIVRDIFVPHHLYGQLVQHKAGQDLLREHVCLSPLIQHIRQQKLETPQQILELKSALWALGHIGTSEDGISMLNNGYIIPEVVKLAEECPVYSIRGTCFYVLGLLATTRIGADLLSQLGWEALRHSRNECWPLVEEINLLCQDDSFSSVGSLSSQLAELEMDDGCSGTLARLDEDETDADMDCQMKLEEEIEGPQRARFIFSEFDEDDDEVPLGAKMNAGAALEKEEVPVEPQRCWSPISHEEEAVLRKPVRNTGNGIVETVPLKNSALPCSSPGLRYNGTSQRGCYHRWSHTLPLMRSRPASASDCPSNSGDSGYNLTAPLGAVPSTNSRQRSRSVTQRPHITENVSEAWERRNRIPGPESVQSSPHGSCSSSRVRFTKLKISTSKERIRSTSFTESSPEGDVHTSVPSCHRSHRHLRSTSNVETGYFRIPGGGSEYGDTTMVSSPHDSNFKDRRSDSNESSRTSASKSRSNSCTDSTSGFSSAGDLTNFRPLPISGPAERPQLLSPIASSSSLNTMSGRTVHHSDSVRKLVNLRKTPVIMCRVSAPLNLVAANLTHNNHHGGPSQNFTMSSSSSYSPDIQTAETSFVYTTTRDAQGYATLKSLQHRRRGFSTCVPPDPKMIESNLATVKTRSLDSRLDIPRLLTYDSLSSLGLSYFDQHPSSVSHSTSTHHMRISKDDVRFVGLCLPVDIGMIFNEDGKEIKLSSTLLTSVEEQKAKLKPLLLSPNMDQDPQFRDKSLDGLEYHRHELCLRCYRVRHHSVNSKEVPPDTEESDNQSLFEGISDLPKSDVFTGEQQIKDQRSQVPCNKIRANSAGASSSVATTPGSLNSIGSCEPGAQRSTENCLSSRTLLRKEIMRLVVNLSSSVATKSAEQGLLNLKQKFSSAFQDLCLYSEIYILISSYNFRLTARRFIQELFLDMTFAELFEEPNQIVGAFEESTA